MAGPSYFFCGIGGSGMLPLAMILRGQGFTVSGSDRSLDQGRLGPKFEFLRAHGVALFAQDGSGVVSPDQVVVVSAAIEETVPDMLAARRIGARVIKRAQLLADLFNAAGRSVGVAGTSGKSTTTGMIGWILSQAGLDPTVMNGAVMKNFISDDTPFASALVGASDVFVSEVDESDGTIALYNPSVAVLNNIAVDHKSIEELRDLFAGFLSRGRSAIVNIDNGEAAALAARRASATTFSLNDPSADFFAAQIKPQPDGIHFELRERDGETLDVRLQVPGRHNVANALAAVAASRALGVSLPDAATALEGFVGLRRRLETVGARGGITVIDDFGHNPDKIEASLETLHAFPGRLLIMFQPHGYGPLKLMREALIDAFVRNMTGEDVLMMPEPVYFGGTVDRAVSSADIVAGIAAAGRNAKAFADRAECERQLGALARPGDRIVIMGARDDTLSVFAADLLGKLAP